MLDQYAGGGRPTAVATGTASRNAANARVRCRVGNHVVR